MKHLILLAAVIVLFQFIDQAYAGGLSRPGAREVVECPCFTEDQLARTVQIVSPEEITTCADIEVEVAPGELLINNVIRVTKEGEPEKTLLGLYFTQLVTDKVYHYHCLYNPVLVILDGLDDPIAINTGLIEPHVITLEEIKACRELFRNYYQEVQNIECPGF
jgi:hypothetical protein